MAVSDAPSQPPAQQPQESDGAPESAPLETESGLPLEPFYQAAGAPAEQPPPGPACC